jgi:hypothetical protein
MNANGALCIISYLLPDWTAFKTNNNVLVIFLRSAFFCLAFATGRLGCTATCNVVGFSATLTSVKTLIPFSLKFLFFRSYVLLPQQCFFS